MSPLLKRFNMLNLVCCLLGAAAIAQTQVAPAEAPLIIKSNQAVFDGKKSENRFIGHVVLTHGTTTVMGDMLIAFHNDKHHITKVKITGNLANYRSLPQGETIPLTAQAKTIWYYPDLDKIDLFGEAIVRQGIKEMRGPKLEYYTKKQLVVATGDSQHQNTLILPP